LTITEEFRKLPLKEDSMRAKFRQELEGARVVTTGPFASAPGDRFGSFKLRCPESSTWLLIIASAGEDWLECGFVPPAWEHVSVSTVQRCPTWEEMVYVKDLFWGPEETVIQLHPPKSEYVNNHPNCLHLWKPVGIALPMPPSTTVGMKGVFLS
jgi:hypothetical protein